MLLRFLSLSENLSHGFSVFVTVIWVPGSYVSTRVWVISPICSTIPYPWITTATAIRSLVRNDSNSRLSPIRISASRIEAFLITVKLQWALWPKEGLPSVSTPWSGTVLPISDQWVQRGSWLIDYYKSELLVNLHTQTDLGEGCTPIGW